MNHYNDVIMGAIASQITSITVVFSAGYSDADQRKHQSSASLAFVWGIHRGPVNSPHKWPVTRKMFPFDDVIMFYFGSIMFLCCTLLCFCLVWLRNYAHIPRSPLTGICRKVSNIRLTLIGNKIVDHSDVVGASPVGAAPTTSSFAT